MAAEPSLAGCTAYIYDENGFFLLKTRITGHDGKTNEIELEGDPGLGRGAACRVTVEASPLPWEYRGRVTGVGASPAGIALYNGKRLERDGRQNRRYKARVPAVIESLIIDGCAYALHTPIEVSVVDISRSGVRIRTGENVIAPGLRFELRLNIGGKDERLAAEAVNSGRSDSGATEYGCGFFGKSEDIKKRVSR